VILDFLAAQDQPSAPEAEGRSSPPPPRRRRTRGSLSGDNGFDLAGAAVAAFSVVFLFGRLTALSGLIGLVLVGYVVFLVVYGVLVSLREDGNAVTDAVMTVFLGSAALIAFTALGLVIFYTIWRGFPALHHLNFYDHDMSSAGPLASLDVGGVAHALVGTLWQIGIALVLAVPLGIVCAVYLDQTRSRFADFVRTIVNAMTAFPSILAGLFIYAFWILTLGFQFSGLAAGLALSIMMLPYIIRTSDLVLRLVPAGLRESSAALGAPRWRTVWHVVLPTARSGLATGVILGTARGIGEASPVLLTAGFTTYMNANPLHEPMVSLPLEALKLVQSGIPAYAERGYATAALLLLVILVLFVTARIIGGFGPGHLTRRQRRRVERLSVRDRARIMLAQGFSSITAQGDSDDDSVRRQR
jgi:phosphate transport system permease protein